MSAIKVYIPMDTTAVAKGADQLAHTVQQKLPSSVQVIRNGSYGLCWLEPMLEVETEQGRVAYGPVKAEDIDSLMAADFLHAGAHPLYQGLTENIPELKQQQRLSFARVGLIDPLSLADYQQHGGFVGLKKALAITPQAIVEQLKDSGLRGRGGAAFPTGIKWQTVFDAQAGQKYIVCNADEGDSGTFADRMLMEGDPFCLIEGMIIAGLAVGANKGYIYLRSEYPIAHQQLQRAINIAADNNFLGNNICASEHTFNVEIRLGAEAYICGEETALLESLEGKRGMVRAKPPLPALEGLFGLPTVVNNVITLASVPIILARGSHYYKDFGMGRSRGTLAVQLAGNIKRGGLYEFAFGTKLKHILHTIGQGSRSGRRLKAVQVGGPLGAYLPESQWDIPLDYEAFAGLNAVLGHGGVVAFDDSVDMAQQARFAMEFCVLESCGKCTPCRIGSTRGVEVIDKIIANDNSSANRELLHELCDTMEDGSLCAMGGMTPFPVRSALNHFASDFPGDPKTGAAS